MNQQPDKFFAEKLAGSFKAAPAGAWEKIEAGLEGKKNYKVIWLRIAASLLFISLISSGLWKLNHKSVENTIASDNNRKNTVVKEVPPPTQPAPVKTPDDIPTEKQSQGQRDIRKTERNTVKKDTPVVPVPVPVKSVDEHSVAAIEVVDDEKQNEIIPVEENEVTDNAVAQNTAEEDEAVTLVYNANEVNEKYLDKEALAKATSDDKKTSTFRKLLNKAYDLKTNSDPLGDLRQKKNEILALNFKSDKRSQNK